jgi:nitrogen fixation protein FixH
MSGVERTGTAWRFFPWYVAGGLGFVVLVNFAMGWAAVQTFPGLATTHGFAESNGYDRVLAAADRQAALGWTVRDSLDGAHPVVTLAGRAGAPLAGARLAATIARPIGEAEPAPLALHAAGPGRYEADAALAPGAWDLDLTVTAEGGEYHTTRRLIVR